MKPCIFRCSASEPVGVADENVCTIGGMSKTSIDILQETNQVGLTDGDTSEAITGLEDGDESLLRLVAVKGCVGFLGDIDEQVVKTELGGVILADIDVKFTCSSEYEGLFKRTFTQQIPLNTCNVEGVRDVLRIGRNQIRIRGAEGERVFLTYFSVGEVHFKSSGALLVCKDGICYGEHVIRILDDVQVDCTVAHAVTTIDSNCSFRCLCRIKLNTLGGFFEINIGIVGVGIPSARIALLLVLTCYEGSSDGEQ